MSPVGALATLVLAAGAGTRFGGAKQLAEVDGVPLLRRVVDAVGEVGEPRVAVLGARAEEVRALVPEPPWKVALAADWAAGPGASLRAGLAAAPAADAALIVLGDLAWLSSEAIERVLAAGELTPDRDAVRAYEGDTPGHPLLIRGGILAAARQAPDEGLRGLLKRSEIVRVECAGLGVTADVDTVADLRRPPS